MHVALYLPGKEHFDFEVGIIPDKERAMRHTIRGISSSLLILLYLFCLPVSAAAYELTLNFDNTPPAQFQANNPATPAYVPTTLSGASGNAYRCFVPSGQRDYYCGMNIYTNQTPLTNDVYVRYYIKFETDWRFVEEFKSVIFEGAGGRSFLNFNPITQTTAKLQVLIYPDGGPWHETGSTISNDGAWHCVEARTFRNINSPANGRFTVWFDGVQVLDLNPHNAGNVNVAYLTLGYRNGLASTDMHVQYEDVVVADHYIGPISGFPPPVVASFPSPPVNLRVQ